MTAPYSATIRNTFAPPVMEARRWLAQATLPEDKPLLNVSQAAPVDPPPEPLRQAMSQAILEHPQAHLYGPVLGNLDLREALAAKNSTVYGGDIRTEQIAITAGCNEAFAATISSIAQAGDEIILPCPWYFNHKMWLDMQGITARPLATDDTLLPDPRHATALIGPKTRAIVLVTPNNPGGAEYPAALLRDFLDLARAHGLALLIDETYRDFHSVDGAPHDLFTDPDWHDTLIQLYSFSKAYRLTGHRVGAIVASQERLAEVEKFLDTVTISPPQTGQIGALYGLRALDDWLAGERQEILSRRQRILDRMTGLNGWHLHGCGAYFAYVRHPFDMPSPELARRLVSDAGILLLPGTMFMPDSHADANKQLRIAFANVDAGGIDRLFDRLSALDYRWR
ncbi:aminotransferase [Qingshengfaniella alkalisoli]|uniref:aspartate transaminase n=1 Tax=Qingshengfaniella alkalisoli TaxID=2599296 RepID=A0A5B8J4N6_9RHOB|nr:aminotransferase [Qingshengfaniella alkalisoli]QDY69240.1 aminotransferase [Qingshengfaniella alkalisoli]